MPRSRRVEGVSWRVEVYSRAMQNFRVRSEVEKIGDSAR